MVNNTKDPRRGCEFREQSVAHVFFLFFFGGRDLWMAHPVSSLQSPLQKDHHIEEDKSK